MQEFGAVTLGDRSMVGQCPLEALIQVRILIAQPAFEKQYAAPLPEAAEPGKQPKPTSLEVLGDGSGIVDRNTG